MKFTRKNIEAFTKQLNSQIGKPGCPLTKADVKELNAKSHDLLDQHEAKQRRGR